jgi:tetratricopeptide (TPR) repeat protein
MAMTLQSQIKWVTNIEDFQKAVESGTNAVVINTTKVDKLTKSLGGEGLFAAVNNYAAAIERAGGVETLSAAQKERINGLVDKAIEKYQALGQVAPAHMLALADATKVGDQATTGWLGSLAALGNSWVARVAEGVLLRDAIHQVLDLVKDGIMAFPDLVKHTTAFGNSLYEMSLKTGASVENLSALRYVASQTGIDFTSFGTTLAKMQQALGSTGAKADELQKHLDVLGLNLQTLKNEKPDQAFIDIMSALENIPNRADQAAAGIAIFGRGFKDMAGLTQESITELMADAERLGLVMSTETAAAAHAAEVGFKALGMQMDSLGMRIGAAFIPAVIGLEESIGQLLTGALDDANQGLKDMGGGNGFLATVARAMGTGEAAIAAQVTLYEMLRDALISVVRYLQSHTRTVMFP